MIDHYEVPYYITVWKNGLVTKRTRRNYKEKITAVEDGEGFLMVNLSSFGFNMRNTTQYVHRLVAERWLPNPEGYEFIVFKDGDPKNVKSSNLEWCP